MRVHYFLTPKHIDRWEDAARNATWSQQLMAGPFSWIIRRVLGCGCVYGPYEALINLCLPWSNRPVPFNQATRRYRAAVECAWIILTGVYIALYYWAYSLTFAVAATPLESHRWQFAILYGICFLCAHRLLDILSLSMRLFVIENFKTRDMLYTLLLVAIAILQSILCFGVFYLTLFAKGDLRVPPPDNSKAIQLPTTQDEVKNDSRFAFIHNRTESFYLSSVIITTLGTGDFKVRYTITKIVVLVEVLFGILFLVVVFNKALEREKPFDWLLIQDPPAFSNYKYDQLVAVNQADAVTLKDALQQRGICATHVESKDGIYYFLLCDRPPDQVYRALLALN
jgi:hypothetical protein